MVRARPLLLRLHGGRPLLCRAAFRRDPKVEGSTPAAARGDAGRPSRRLLPVALLAAGRSPRRGRSLGGGPRPRADRPRPDVRGAAADSRRLLPILLQRLARSGRRASGAGPRPPVCRGDSHALAGVRGETRGGIGRRARRGLAPGVDVRVRGAVPLSRAATRAVARGGSIDRCPARASRAADPRPRLHSEDPGTSSIDWTGRVWERVRNAGLGRLLLSAPFIPTVPGTDRYTDELW